MKKTYIPNSIKSDIDFLNNYLKDTEKLLDILCKNYNVSYEDFVPICSLANELKIRLSGVHYALS